MSNKIFTSSDRALLEKVIGKKISKETLVKSELKDVSLPFLDDLTDLQRQILDDPSRFKALLLGRRCLASGTLVATPTGPRPIQDLKVGDSVLGWNGKAIESTEVLNVFDQGVQPVVSLENHNREAVKCTLDHVWLTTNDFHIEKQQQTRDIKRNTYIKRQLFNCELGSKQVNHAYALGALLGDGCCRQGSNYSFHISSENDSIPSAVALQLGCKVKKQGGGNYTYNLYSTGTFASDSGIEIRVTGSCDYYKEWCKGKYAHEKIADLEEIKQWNRQSALAYLAGLLDTDGCVIESGNVLTISWMMQAKAVIESVKWLVMALWQFDPSIYEDSREKYKNGSVWVAMVRNNRVAKRALQELSPYIQCDRKKYKPEYDSLLANNSAEDHYGVKVVDYGEQVQTYDIEVNNSTNLYVLANQGLITHNSGKSYLLTAVLVKTALTRPNSNCLFIAQTLKAAKRLIWKQLQSFNSNYNLGFDFNHVELVATAPNGSRIRLGGCETLADAEKYRGDFWDVLCVDEAASWFGTADHLEYFLTEVLGPALDDKTAPVYLAGTPNRSCSGYYHKVTTSPSKYKVFTGTVLLNEKFPKWKGKANWKDLAERFLAAKREEEGWEEDDPIYRREWKCQWISDSEVFVIPFDDSKNIYASLPIHVGPDDWHHVIGIDLGYNDATAMVILAYSKHDPYLYIVDYFTKTKMYPEEIAEKILELNDCYNPDCIVVDPAAGGKAHIEQLAEQYNLPIQSAHKAEKMHNLELLASDFSHGLIKVQKDLDDLINELKNVKWLDKAKGKISSATPDHSCFIAGTKITTIDGYRDIETISPGDLVLTRKGYRKVKDAKLTNLYSPTMTITFSNGKILTGSPNHPIFVNSKGFVEIAKLKKGDRVIEDLEVEVAVQNYAVTVESIQKSLSLPVYNLTVEDQHEYFANGVLVSNCDALRYGFLETLRDRKPRQISNKTENEEMEDAIWDRTMAKMAEQKKEMEDFFPDNTSIEELFGI